jgi:acetyl esterase/lipase
MRPLKILLTVIVLIGVLLVGTPAQAAVTTKLHVPYRTVDGVTVYLDLYLPSGAGPFPGILAVHGGGFENDNPVANQAAQFTTDGFVVIAPHYRLAPTFQWPAQLDDTQAALDWARANASALKLDPNRIGVWGPSAGGNLAYLLTTPGHGPVKAAAGWSGATDLTKLGDLPEVFGCARAECPGVYRSASPLLITQGGVPTFIANSTDELVPEVQATQYAAKLQGLGTPTQLMIVPGSRHGLALSGTSLASTMGFFQKVL